MGQVGMLVSMLLVVELPGVLQKCIFDEVQARARVVRAAPGRPDDPPTDQSGHRGRRVSPLHILSVRWRRRRNVVAPKPHEPIRIRSWITGESGGLSEAEGVRLQMAVGGAVETVASLLSGMWRTCCQQAGFEPVGCTHTHIN